MAKVNRDSDSSVALPAPLLAEIRGAGLGEHGEALMLLLIQQCLDDGLCKCNAEVVRGVVGRGLERDFFSLLRKHAVRVRGHIPGVSAAAYSFKGTAPSLNPLVALEFPKANLVRVRIASKTLSEVHARWGAVCQRNKWLHLLDIHGTTSVGRANQLGFSAVSIVKLTTDQIMARACRADDDPITNRQRGKRHVKVIRDIEKRGIFAAVFRKRGRFYHSFSNLDREIQELCTFYYNEQSEPADQIDQSASFTANLIGAIAPQDSRASLIKAQQSGDLYRQTYEHLPKDIQAEYNLDDPVSYARFKGHFQRDVLFSRLKTTYSVRPIARALRRWQPEFSKAIERKRVSLGVSGFYDFLTGLESSIFSPVIAKLGEMGVPVISRHDSIQVPRSMVQTAMEWLQKQALSMLGYTPRFSVKQALSLE